MAELVSLHSRFGYLLYCLVALLLPLFLRSVLEFIRFLLLSHVVLLSEWSVGLSDMAYTYADLKLFGVHFSYFVFVLYVFTRSRMQFLVVLLLIFTAYTIIGVFGSWLLIDLIDDLKIYSAFILLIGVIYFTRFSWIDLPRLVTFPLVTWVFYVVLVDLRYSYAPGLEFYATSSALTFVPLLINRFKEVRLLLGAILLILIAKNGVYLGGKWLLYSGVSIVFLSPVLFTILLVFGLPTFIAMIPADKLYRASQLIELASLDGRLMTKSNSIGNVLAEMSTLFKRPAINSFLGNGFGAGVQDYLSLLRNMAGVGGYDISRIEYGTYNKLHLGFSDVLLKFGLIGISLLSILLGPGLVLFGFFLFGTANKETLTFFCLMHFYDRYSATKM